MTKSTIMIYRRNHTGDPNSEGVFGCNDCMGAHRDRAYDSIVGIGGLAPWPGYEGIAGKINWIGIGVRKIDPYIFDPEKFRGSWVTFEHFLLWEAKGPSLEQIAPQLYEYMFMHGRIPRSGYCPMELYDEVTTKILPLAANAPPSEGPIQMTGKHSSRLHKSHCVKGRKCRDRK